MVYPIDSGRVKPHRVYHNQNYNAPGEEEPLQSSAHTGREWTRANIRAGGESSNYLELSFFTDILRNYFTCFLDPENSIFSSVTSKLLGAFSGFLDGFRDKRMYEEVYAEGLTDVARGKISDSQVANQEYNNPNSFRDDFMENELLRVQRGERIISKFWSWATTMAGIKPFLFMVTSFLPDKWKTAIETVEETPSRALWRLRFNPGALHANFVTTAWDLLKLKTMSIFGGEATAEYRNKVGEVENLARTYFKNKYNGTHDSGSKSGLGVYFSMLFDRMKEHWNGVVNPRAVLEKKVKDGYLKTVTKAEKDADRNKTFDRGYVDLSSKKDKENEDVNHQWMRSMTDLTGPICGGLGLVGSFVFEPLRVLWNVAGIETGKNLISALSASRKSLSMVNYIFRFIWEEMRQGGRHVSLEKYMDSNPNGQPPNKALRELHSALRARYANGLFGMSVAAGNILEPFLHLFGGGFQENRFAKFLFNMLIKFNDNGLVRLFSRRRECLGRIENLNLMAASHIYGSREIKPKDYAGISDAEFDERAREISAPKPDGQSEIPYLSTVANAYEKVKSVISGGQGEEGLIKAAFIN